MPEALRRVLAPIPSGKWLETLFKWEIGFEKDVPDPLEFVISDRYLNRGQILYPRQATILKIVNLREDLFTQYDYDVIGEWQESFRRTADDRGYGNNGTQPDLLDRIRICKGEGRPWFRESVVAIGRRGSKGYLGGLCGSYVLWNYMAKGNPQQHYGVDRDKKLAGFVFAGKKEQAKTNQWRDLVNVILGSNCFAPYISKALGESLTVFAPADFLKLFKRWQAGVRSEDDPASFEIVPKESTTMAGRGPASFMQFYDEMAHVVAAGGVRPAEEVYGAATPSLDQFGVDAFIWEPSSTWQQIGQFYENWEHALQVEEDGTPVYPEMFMLQLTSWDPYKDWEKAHTIPIWPDDTKTFNRLQGPIQAYDDQMERLERANPDTFRVERRSHWAAALNAYLQPDRIADIWKPWPTESRPMEMQSRGILSRAYRAHGDPSKSGANFGFAIAHMEGPDERGLPHVVFDVLHAWLPVDFPDHQVDYEQIGNELADYLDRFMPFELTFDQFNSVSTIQALNRHARKSQYPKRVNIYERTATGPLNWKTYETFKTAIGLGLVHAPYFELADLELTFLQDEGHQKVDHPTSGPVQTKDVADCMAIVTYELIGDQVAALIGQSLSDLPVGGAQPGGVQPFGKQMNEEAHQALSNFGRGRHLPGHGAPRRPRGPRGY